MNKYNTLVCLLVASAFTMGMSSPSEVALEQKAAHKSSPDTTNYTKPHAGIELNYNRVKNLQVGESVELDLNFKVQAQAEQLRIKIVHEDGLQLNAQTDYEFDTLTNKKNHLAIQITALQEGRKNIDISATILVNGKLQSRSFTVPVTVGDPSNFKPRASMPGYTVDKERGVVSMPAVQTTE